MSSHTTSPDATGFSGQPPLPTVTNHSISIGPSCVITVRRGSLQIALNEQGNDAAWVEKADLKDLITELTLLYWRMKR